jgi:[NiFe] hydrogenase assembly HybE family chaperone
LLLLPEPGSIWQTQAPGSKFSQTFPYGVFEFTVANEAQLGVYALCSLFSPMFQFEDQSAAVAAAQAALQGLLASPAPRAVSRRNLLRGNLGTGNT